MIFSKYFVKDQNKIRGTLLALILQTGAMKQSSSFYNKSKYKVLNKLWQFQKSVWEQLTHIQESLQYLHND